MVTDSLFPWIIRSNHAWWMTMVVITGFYRALLQADGKVDWRSRTANNLPWNDIIAVAWLAATSFIHFLVITQKRKYSDNVAHPLYGFTPHGYYMHRNHIFLELFALWFMQAGRKIVVDIFTFAVSYWKYGIGPGSNVSKTFITYRTIWMWAFL